MENKLEFGQVNLEAVNLPVLQFKCANDGAGGRVAFLPSFADEHRLRARDVR